MSARFDLGGDVTAEISLDDDAPKSAQVQFFTVFALLFIEQTVALAMRAMINRAVADLLQNEN